MKALNILVVDDAYFIRDLVKKAVRAQYPAFNVDDAVDGLKAQSMMKKGDYHVILCDWEMPNMSGLELLQWMRGDKNYAKTPFLMITSRSAPSGTRCSAGRNAKGSPRMIPSTPIKMMRGSHGDMGVV